MMGRVGILLGIEWTNVMDLMTMDFKSFEFIKKLG